MSTEREEMLALAKQLTKYADLVVGRVHPGVRATMLESAAALRLAAAPPAAGSPELSMLLRLADHIVAHGRSITYPSIGAAQEVRNVVRQLAEALRRAGPLAAGSEAGRDALLKIAKMDGGPPFQPREVAMRKIARDAIRAESSDYGSDALTAQPETASNVREGWKLVPIVADDAMRDAAVIGSRANISYADFDALWPEVIAVAPSPPRRIPG